MKMSRKESQAKSIEPEPGWKQVEAKEKGKGKADESRKAATKNPSETPVKGYATAIEQTARDR